MIGPGVITGALEHPQGLPPELPQGLQQGLQQESLTMQGSEQITACCCCGWKREFQASRQHSPIRHPPAALIKVARIARVNSLFMVGLLPINVRAPANK
jgi:hypothetical protein